MKQPTRNSASLLTPVLRERLVSVGREPGAARWRGLSSAPLLTVVARYVVPGAEIWNIPGTETVAAPASRRTGL
jgi:hypothetical protein